MLTLIWGGVALVGTGCSMSERVEYSDLEGRIPADFFEKINTYTVSEAWLVSQLGRASIVQDGPRQQKIHTYKVTSKKIEQVNYMWLIRSSEAQQSTRYLHFVIVDDKLRTHWDDTFPLVSFNEPPVNTTFIRDEIDLTAAKENSQKTMSQDDEPAAMASQAAKTTTSAKNEAVVTEVDLMQADHAMEVKEQERVTPNKGVTSKDSEPEKNTPPPKEFNFPPSR